MSSLEPSVIVPTFNGLYHLRRLLSSLAVQTLSHEVVLVDNGSTDGTANAVRTQWPNVRLLRLPTNVGFGKAVNAGVAAATGSALVLMNNDIVCPPPFLERLCAALDVDRGVVMAAPVLVRAADPQRVDSAGIVLDPTLHGFNYLYGARLDELTDDTPPPLAPSGGVALFDRGAFEAVGGFDPAFFAYIEDVDLAVRCVASGWRCALAREAVAIHEHSGTLGEGSRRKNQLTAWGRGYMVGKYRLHRRPLLLAWAVAGETVMGFGKLVVDRDIASTVAFVRGWGAGLSTEHAQVPELPRDKQRLSLAGGFRRRATRRFVLRTRS